MTAVPLPQPLEFTRFSLPYHISEPHQDCGNTAYNNTYRAPSSSPAADSSANTTTDSSSVLLSSVPSSSAPSSAPATQTEFGADIQFPTSARTSISGISTAVTASTDASSTAQAAFSLVVTPQQQQSGNILGSGPTRGRTQSPTASWFEQGHSSSSINAHKPLLHPSSQTQQAAVILTDPNQQQQQLRDFGIAQFPYTPTLPPSSYSVYREDKQYPVTTTTTTTTTAGAAPTIPPGTTTYPYYNSIYQYSPAYGTMPGGYPGGGGADVKPNHRELAKARRHVCPVCDKRFNRPSSLNTHMSVHTGAKPYQCLSDGCGRRFSVSSNLRRHERTHQQRGREVASARIKQEVFSNPKHTSAPCSHTPRSSPSRNAQPTQHYGSTMPPSAGSTYPPSANGYPYMWQPSHHRQTPQQGTGARMSTGQQYAYPQHYAQHAPPPPPSASSHQHTSSGDSTNSSHAGHTSRPVAAPGAPAYDTQHRQQAPYDYGLSSSTHSSNYSVVTRTRSITAADVYQQQQQQQQQAQAQQAQQMAKAATSAQQPRQAPSGHRSLASSTTTNASTGTSITTATRGGGTSDSGATSDSSSSSAGSSDSNGALARSGTEMQLPPHLLTRLRATSDVLLMPQPHKAGLTTLR